MSAIEQARAHLEAGEFRGAREAALEALEAQPDDAEALRLAGRAGVELAEDDAVDQLRKVTELKPDDAEAWHDLGDALATEGRSDEANDAFRKALELNPDDELALTALGHTAYAAGSGEDAVSLLEQASERSSEASTATLSLVDMYRTMGKPEEALGQAQKVAEAAPDAPLAILDVAELSLEVGRLDESMAAFARLRELVELPEHEVCALHGMIRVELRGDDQAGALEHAREAAAIDQHGRTSALLAFLEEQEGESPPSAEEVDAALSASLRELRRFYG